MKSWHGLPSHGCHGFYMIGLLIVVVIILVVLISGPLQQDPVTQVTGASCIPANRSIWKCCGEVCASRHVPAVVLI